MKIDRTAVLAMAFPLLMLAHSAAFYLLPFPMLVATAALVGLLGLVVALLALLRLLKLRNLRALVVAGIVLVTWLLWILSPIRELGILARFVVQRHSYEIAVSQTKGGALPECLSVRECASDRRTPPYLVFPFAGLPNAWIGIVHVPEDNQAPLPERLSDVGSAPNCDAKPIAPHYYACRFY